MTDDEQSTFFQIIQERNSLAGVKRIRKHRPSQPCQFDGCAGWAWAQGYCGTHYHRLRSQGKLPPKRILNDPVRRFYSKIEVNPETLCWEWQAYIHPTGYALMGIGGKAKMLKVHRFSFELFFGDIPPGLQVMHACDNRRCSNPAHLSAGTGRDNMQDCLAKGRNAAAMGTAGPKLTSAMAQNIRVMYARGLVGAFGNKANPYSIRNLAIIYGVTDATIAGILKGKAWQAT
jgi:hypothetical protein